MKKKSSNKKTSRKKQIAKKKPSINKTQKCNCEFCEALSRYPENYSIDLFHEFMDDNGYDLKYILEWNMPKWYKKKDLEDPAMFYFIILPYITNKYNLDPADYIEKIPEIKKWIMNSSNDSMNFVFESHEQE